MNAEGQAVGPTGPSQGWQVSSSFYSYIVAVRGPGAPGLVSIHEEAWNSRLEGHPARHQAVFVTLPRGTHSNRGTRSVQVKPQVGWQDASEWPDPELLRKCPEERTEIVRSRNDRRSLCSAERARASHLFKLRVV